MKSPAPNPATIGAAAEVADRLRAAVARLSRSLRLTHADGNLSPSQREVLFTITRRGPLRLSELAASEGLNPTMVSRIVSHLENAQLVTRSPDGTDARVVHLESTNAGRALCQEMRNELTDVLPTLEALVETLRSRE